MSVYSKSLHTYNNEYSLNDNNELHPYNPYERILSSRVMMFETFLLLLQFTKFPKKIFFTEKVL